MKYVRFLALSVLFVTACDVAREKIATTLDTMSEISIPSVSEEIGQKPMSDRLLGKGACPKVEVVADLARHFDFLDSSHPDGSSVLSKAALMKTASACDYGPKSVTVDMNLEVYGIITPLGLYKNPGGTSIAYPFFVAVVEPGGGIMTKELFTAPLPYAPGRDQQTYSQKFRQIIPLANRENGKSYKIMIGFQLSKPQLDYNRTLLKQAQTAAASQALQQRKAMTGQGNVVTDTRPPGAAAPGSKTEPVSLVPASSDKTREKN